MAWKIAHYYTARVNKPAIVSLEDDSWCITNGEYSGKAFVTCDEANVYSGKIKAVNAAGKVCYEKCFGANYPEFTTQVDDIKFAVSPEDKVIFIRLELFDAEGNEIFCDTRHYGVPDFKELFKLESSEVTVADIADKGDMAEITLENKSNTVASGVRLRLKDVEIDNHYFIDNYIDLLPGEKRTVTVKFANNAKLAGTLEISGWNVNFSNYTVR